MENYLLVALIVLIFWLVGIVAYLFVSSRQLDIEHEINDLNATLDTSETAVKSE